MARDQLPPPCLWRTFSKRAHAEGLVEGGVVRLGRLDVYQTIEDSGRRDRGEGEAVSRTPGIETKIFFDRDPNIPTETVYQRGCPKTHFSSTPRTYVYCCSYLPGNDPSLLPEDFGKYRVRINDPQRFCEQLSKSASAHPLAGESTTAECIPVRYDKGACLSKSPTVTEGIELSYSQKDPKYKTEFEHRIVVRVRLDSDLPDFIELQLPAPLAYAEYSKDPE